MAFSELAHAGERSKYRQTEIFRQVVPNMIKHTFETISWQASLVGYWCVTAHCVTIQQIYSQRIGQTFAVEASRRQARIQAGRQARRDEPSDCVG